MLFRSPADDLEYIGEGAPVDEQRNEQVAEDTLAALKAMLGN